jgi:hypothetical protein
VSGRRVRVTAGALIAALLVCAGAAGAATRYDPRLRFRTISTPRFDIHFHQGGETLARRLARIVEEAAAEIDRSIGPPAGRVQVILVDQHDLANGWATPLPYNTIEINAASPSAEATIGNTDDWLRLVFVHEYAHIAHLSQAGGWIGGLRRVFGRHPVLFPNLYQPLWAIEGIATWQESASTGQGRVPAGDFRLVLERAAAGGRFDPIDRAGGGNVDWPTGMTPYLYGAYFHEFLTARYGAESLRRLSGETARRPPYLASLAYRRVFGRSLGALWRDFAEATRDEAAAPGAGAARLTYHGFNVSGPRHGPDGRIFYSASSPRHFPALMEVRAGEVPRKVTTRYLGHSIGIAGDRLVVDEIDAVRSVGLQSDLYVVDPASGERRRLTREGRAADPDVAADGRIVCTIQTTEGRALALLAGASQATLPEILVQEAFTDFASPRWSPDGRAIAAERRRVGGPSEIVLVDPDDGAARVLASLSDGRSASPAWTPDGAHVLFAAAVGAGPFRIYRVDVAGGTVELLDGTGANARSPDVAPDGRTLVFVGYTVDGYDLFTLPLAGADWRAVPVPDETEADGSTAKAELSLPTSAPDIDVRGYSPLRTLVPTSWTPIVESDAGDLVIGAAVGGVDALGRHGYAVQAAWSTDGRPDWQVAYAYDRWRPTLFAAASADTDSWGEGTYTAREMAAGLFLRVSRVRVTHATLVAFQRTDETGACETCAAASAVRQRRAALRLGWELSNARAFGYSVSPEEGGRLSATMEAPRRAFGSDGDGVTLTADVRLYRRVGPPHAVVAWRAAAAGSWGDLEAGRIVSASGSGPQRPGLQFGRGAVGLLRGYPEDQVAGRRAAVVNLDYRVPIARIGRGLGTAPFFLRHLHGALFFDAGHAWTGDPRWADLRMSVGAELSADSVVGFVLPVTFTAGAAWRRDGQHGPRDVAAFGRIGRAF